MHPGGLPRLTACLNFLYFYLLHCTTVFLTPRGHIVGESFENYVTVAEAAKRLNIHEESVRRLIRSGKLLARKFANAWLIEKTTLEQFASNYDPRPGRKATLL